MLATCVSLRVLVDERTVLRVNPLSHVRLGGVLNQGFRVATVLTLHRGFRVWVTYCCEGL